MLEELHKLRSEIMAKLETIKDRQTAEDFSVQYLGRKGILTAYLRRLTELPAEERKIIGAQANDLKDELSRRLSALSDSFSGTASASAIDVTLPGQLRSHGHVHPISRLIWDLSDLFAGMGFMVLDGPELESDWFNFEALNIPPFHPARDMQDTFYLSTKNKSGQRDLVMRTQTSPVQVRALLKYGAPLRCVVPGRVFRSEAIDACHEHTFHQMEGLVVDENISIANMIASMKVMISTLFGRDIETRIRPGFFPFVEPGIELDMRCTICDGSGCPACKHSGWLEILPGGMVHPNVLRAGGIDPERYSGFAFGLGLTRMAMMYYGIDDIRHFNSGDLRFVRQF